MTLVSGLRGRNGSGADAMSYAAPFRSTRQDRVDWAAMAEGSSPYIAAKPLALLERRTARETAPQHSPQQDAKSGVAKRLRRASPKTGKCLYQNRLVSVWDQPEGLSLGTEGGISAGVSV